MNQRPGDRSRDGPVCVFSLRHGTPALAATVALLARHDGPDVVEHFLRDLTYWDRIRKQP